MSILDVKFVSVPSKRLKKALSASSDRLVLNNIRNWENESGEATNLTPANFGDTQYVVLRDKNNTRLEIIEIDPSTIADSEITILKRGLQFDGDLVEEPTLKQAWEVSGTIVELGTHTPQALESLLRLTKQNDFTIIPRTFEVDGVTPAIADEDAQVINKGQLDTAISEIDDDKVSKSGDTMSGVLNMGTQKITNVANSTDDGDAVNRAQLNAAIFAGALPATETQMGLVELATQEQIDNQTDVGETGAPLVVVPSKIPGMDWKASKDYAVGDKVIYDTEFYDSLITPNLNKIPGQDFLADPFNLSKLTLPSAFSVGTHSKFYNDGLVFVTVNYSTKLFTISILSIPYNSDSIVSTTSNTITRSTDSILAFDFSEDGEYFIVAWDDGGIQDFDMYNLSNPWVIDTGLSTFSTFSGTGIGMADGVVDIYIKNSTEIFFMYDDLTSEYLGKITITTPWVISSNAFTSLITLNASTEGGFMSAGFTNDGMKFWYSGTGFNNVWIMDLDTAYDFTGKTYLDAVQNTDLDLASVGGRFWINNDEDACLVGNTAYRLGEAYWQLRKTGFGAPIPISGTSGVTTEAPSAGFWFGKYEDSTSSSTTASISMVMSGIPLASMKVAENNSFCFPCSAGDTITFSHSWTVTAYFIPLTT